MGNVGGHRRQWGMLGGTGDSGEHWGDIGANGGDGSNGGIGGGPILTSEDLWGGGGGRNHSPSPS